MEICLQLIRTRLKEIQVRLDLLGIEVEQVEVEFWPSFSVDFKISLWDGKHYIRESSNKNAMSITEFNEWYKHKQILLRKF